MIRQVLLFALFVSVAFAAPQNRERRIVGGVDNVLGEIPWAVSLRTIAGLHFCTGSVLNNWYVITSAHCIDGRGASTIHLVLGRITLDGLTGMNRQGFRVIIHPAYDVSTQNADVGLIQVSVIITFNANVQAISLGDTMIGTGVSARVSGWGSTEQDFGPTSNNLRSLDTTTLSLNECQDRHTWWNAERINMNHLCTNNGVNEGFCMTGAGGSLVSNSQLIGVASWNVPCALGYPDVYVRISTFRTWIMSQIGSQ
ncbi:hypothetical protein PVAND_000922 [Polypedilum vanderplanki]|uniref:Peptidase S1 domain-containing protein n=1 Tax=Polypedilum vanderplanki TaxID=319348 RepID=A0A9J6BLM9_POLVA|nr:hypothetical protein PVAND_000922 [Polypedilum vanderplanki]